MTLPEFQPSDLHAILETMDEMTPVVDAKLRGWALARERFNSANIESAQTMAQSALSNILDKPLVSTSPEGMMAMESIGESAGVLTGLTAELKGFGKKLVWRVEKDPEQLSSNWSVSVRDWAYAVSDRRDGKKYLEEAEITADKANELTMIMMLNEDDITVDLHEWFTLGVVGKGGKVLWEDANPDGLPFRAPDRMKANRRMRFEVRDFSEEDLADRLAGIEKSSRAKIKFAPDEKLLVARAFNHINGKISRTVFPKSAAAVESDIARTDIRRTQRANLIQALERVLSDYSPQDNSFETKKLSGLWALSEVAAGLGQRIVREEDRYVLINSAFPLGKRKDPQIDSRFRSSLEKVRQAKDTTREKKVRTVIGALGWDTLLDQSRMIPTSSADKLIATQMASQKLRGVQRLQFERGLAGMAEELERFMTVAAAKLSTHDVRFDQTVLLNAFLLKSQIFSIIRPWHETKDSTVKTRRYWQGVLAAGKLLATDLMDLDSHELSVEGVRYDRQIGTGKKGVFDFTKTNIFTRNENTSQEKAQITKELLEKIFA